MSTTFLASPHGFSWRRAWPSPTSVAFLFAPIGVLAGWTIMRLGGSHSTGAGWITAHAVWLVGYGLFGFIIAELHRQARTPPRGRAAALAAAIAAAAGLVAVIGQMTVDIIIGMMASNRTQMDGLR